MEFNKVCDAIALNKIEVIRKNLPIIKDKIRRHWQDIFEIACRYGEPDTIKALLECGATFTEKDSWEPYITKFLDDDCSWVSEKDLYVCKKDDSWYIRQHCYQCMEIPNLTIEPTSKETRLASLKVLLDNCNPNDIGAQFLLFYAIIAQNREFIDLLKSYNVTLSEGDSQSIIDGTFFSYTREFFYHRLDARAVLMTIINRPTMHFSKFLSIIEDLRKECSNEKIIIDSKFYKRYIAPVSLEFADKILDNFDLSEINKMSIMKYSNTVSQFEVYEKFGWLNTSKIVDTLIAEATKHGYKRVVSWLTDYKRTRFVECSDEPFSKIWTTKKCYKGVCITKFNNKTDTLEIPAKIGEFPVITLDFARSCKLDSIKTLIIPEGVKNLVINGDITFSNVEKLSIPSTLTHIPMNAFNNSKITSITIPSSCKLIGCEAFNNCKELTDVTISEGVERIANYAFGNCDKLERVVLPRSLNSESLSFSENTKLVVYRGSWAYTYYTRTRDPSKYEIIN